MEVEETFFYFGSGGQVSNKTTWINNQAAISPYQIEFSQDFSWDELGNLASQTYPTTDSDLGSGRMVSNHFSEGVLVGVSDQNTQFATLDHHASGLLERVSYGDSTKDEWTADPSGIARLLEISMSGADQPWTTGSYSYDSSGNIRKIGGDGYLYDLAGRLKKATVQDRSHTQTFGYDAFGNLNAMTTNGSSAADLAVESASNRLVESTYDAAGNVIGWDGDARPYRAAYYPAGEMRQLDQLDAAGGSSHLSVYAYTASGERIAHFTESSLGITYTLRGLDNKALSVFKETPAETGGVNWTFEKDYIYRGDKTLATVVADATSGSDSVRYFHLDHLGTVRRTTGNGQVVGSHDYFPYGEEVSNPYADDEVMQFTGHERDSDASAFETMEDDLDYMHARYYSPHSARFLGVDPVRGNVGSSMSWNRYAYVHGNPIGKTDPTGRVPQWVADVGAKIKNFTNDTIQLGADAIERVKIQGAELWDTRAPQFAKEVYEQFKNPRLDSFGEDMVNPSLMDKAIKGSKKGLQAAKALFAVAGKLARTSHQSVARRPGRCALLGFS